MERNLLGVASKMSKTYKSHSSDLASQKYMNIYIGLISQYGSDSQISMPKTLFITE